MALADALKLVDKKWAAEFQTFVESGDASDAFFEFLDKDPNCQKAVDMVLEQKSRGLQRVGALLQSDEMTGTRPKASMEHKTAQLAQALGVAARLPANERTRVVSSVMEQLGQSQRDKKGVADLGAKLAQAANVKG